MQNQNNLYKPLFPQYDSGIYGRYNNFHMPLKYASKQKKRYNYCFSSEEENINPNVFYILTDKNNQVKNQNLLNKLYTGEAYSFSNSQNNYKEYKPTQEAFKNIEKYKNNSAKKNDLRLTNNNYISFTSGIDNRDFNSKDADNICYNLFIKETKKKQNNCILKKKYSSIAIGNCNLNNISENYSYYNIKNNSYSCYNQPFTKHNNHSLFIRDYNIINNKEYNNKDKNDEKPIVDKGENELNYDYNTFRSGKCGTINNCGKTCINNNKINECTQKIDKGLIKNRTINNIYNNNSNISKIVKNNKSVINSISNKKETKSNKLPINKNISYSKIETLDEANKFIKNHCQIENKKKINLVINTSNTIIDKKKYENIPSIPSNKPNDTKKIKKISLINFPNWNDNLDNKNNHSFYEIKSLKKDLSQKNLHQKPINNNEIIHIVCKRKTNNETKTFKEKFMKNISNTKLIEDNYAKEKNDIKTRKIDLTEINPYIRKEGNYKMKKGASKTTFETTYRTETSNNDPKTNENINYMNINNISYNSYNNNFIVEDKLKKGKNDIIKIDKIKHKNSSNYLIPSGKKITNKEKISIINNEYIFNLKNKEINNRGISTSSAYIDIKKPVEIKKICSNYFSYYCVKDNESKNKKNTKRKAFNNKRNMIQLLNINNKTYEEDFPFESEGNIYNSNNNLLKPQISFRIALFGNKEPEYEKYFVVNTFCSENIREKPDESESDFY